MTESMNHPSGTTAQVDKLPPCDICKIDARAAGAATPPRIVEVLPAKYDFKTVFGMWAYGCTDHWKSHRWYDTLGVGKGQELIVS